MSAIHSVFRLNCNTSLRLRRPSRRSQKQPLCALCSTWRDRNRCRTMKWPPLPSPHPYRHIPLLRTSLLISAFWRLVSRWSSSMNSRWSAGAWPVRWSSSSTCWTPVARCAKSRSSQPSGRRPTSRWTTRFITRSTMTTTPVSTSLLQNKHAVIFGAGGEVGSAVAKEFAAQGATVFLSGRHLASVEQVAADVRQDDGKAIAAVIDALDEQAVNAYLDGVAHEWGSIDILLNVTGPQAKDYGNGNSTLELPLEQFLLPLTTLVP